MAVRIVLLVRKTTFRENKHPYISLQSKTVLNIDNLGSEVAYLDVEKGIGQNATIKRNESAFVKFLLVNYGTGRFVVHKTVGSFVTFWSGYVEKDRYIRDKGVVAPYLKSNTPRQWHALDFTNLSNGAG